MIKVVVVVTSTGSSISIKGCSTVVKVVIEVVMTVVVVIVVL